jgi:hypothetical protein
MFELMDILLSMRNNGNKGIKDEIHIEQVV